MKSGLPVMVTVANPARTRALPCCSRPARVSCRHLNAETDFPPPQNALDDADSYRLRAVTKADDTEVANEIAQDSQFSLMLDRVASGAVVVIAVTIRNAAKARPATW